MGESSGGVVVASDIQSSSAAAVPPSSKDLAKSVSHHNSNTVPNKNEKIKVLQKNALLDKRVTHSDEDDTFNDDYSQADDYDDEKMI